ERTRHPQPEKAVLEEASRRYEAAVCAGARPIAHGREILALLQSQDYRLGLISNTMFSGASHRQDLERFGLAEYFETMLFSADENKWKPNEEAFYQVADALQVNPIQAVFVGDDPAADMVGARRAGMIAVHFPSSSRFQTADSLLADATIHTLRELPGVLEQLQ
ncbi:MAG: HAD family hydrolase, partial [Candidatus Promineifilaceae bacterium]|nr:HAD family hydrolase [Candidatus Promineifilaceae bacterium]